jgi:biopolymer transport protein ExbD
VDAPAGGEEESGSSGKSIFGEEQVASVSLNLTALMDILSNLLFFLLAAFGATIVMAINGNVPVSSSEKNDIAATRQTVTANVSVAKSGFDVQIFGSAQTPAELDRWRKHIPTKDGRELDYAALTEHLLAIKQEYPRSDTMILTAESGIKYETMVSTMDAARESNVKVGGTSHVVPVFPTVVVSTVTK